MTSVLFTVAHLKKKINLLIRLLDLLAMLAPLLSLVDEDSKYVCMWKTDTYI